MARARSRKMMAGTLPARATSLPLNHSLTCLPGAKVCNPADLSRVEYRRPAQTAEVPPPCHNARQLPTLP